MKLDKEKQALCVVQLMSGEDALKKTHSAVTMPDIGEY